MKVAASKRWIDFGCTSSEAVPPSDGSVSAYALTPWEAASPTAFTFASSWFWSMTSLPTIGAHAGSALPGSVCPSIVRPAVESPFSASPICVSRVA